MKYVLDSSIAVKWVIPEPDTGKAIRLLDEFDQGIHEFISPDIFPIEVAHALAKAERQGRIDPGAGILFLTGVMANLPYLLPSLPLLARAFAIASSARIGVYDCLYVALAEQQQCELLTADDRLAKVLQPQFAFIQTLASLP